MRILLFIKLQRIWFALKQFTFGSFGCIDLFGTLYPLIYEAITDGKQISVGAPYFGFIIFPFAIILGLLQEIALFILG